MTSIAARIQLGTAAVALAAAASLAPVVAQADSMAPLRPALTSFAQGLGDTAGQPVGAVVCANAEADACTLVAAEQSNALASANATSSDSWFTPLIQNQLWWCCTPNPNPPTQNEWLTIQWINIPIIGWFAALLGPDINFSVCFLGFTVSVGPYGTTSVSSSRGCA